MNPNGQISLLPLVMLPTFLLKIKLLLLGIQMEMIFMNIHLLLKAGLNQQVS